MRKLSLITSGVILMLSFLMVGCNTMKKLERGHRNGNCGGKVSPQQLTAVDGVVILIIILLLLPSSFIKS